MKQGSVAITDWLLITGDTSGCGEPRREVLNLAPHTGAHFGALFNRQQGFGPEVDLLFFQPVVLFEADTHGEHSLPDFRKLALRGAAPLD